MTLEENTLDRRSCLTTAAFAAVMMAGSNPSPAHATIGNDSYWPLWPALPVAPYSCRKTIRQEVVPNQVWIFDQLIGIYYVHVPIRMTVVASTKLKDNKRGLLVYAPVAPTTECRSLLQELIDDHGPISTIILPSVAVEHKVLAGPFARTYPDADFYVTDRQYSFPLPLPDRFLGLPPWTKPLPTSSSPNDTLLGPDFAWEVLTVQPGPASMYQDVALLHKSSKTLLVCDVLFATTAEPPPILQNEPEYTRALLFHARDSKDELVPDTPENRRKGWRRIVLLFNFFFPGGPGIGRADLGLAPVLKALQTPTYPLGWGGWMPFTFEDEASELLEFERFTDKGKPTIYTVVQIILARGGQQLKDWVGTVSKWDFVRAIPAHLDAPLNIGPKEFAETYDFLQRGRNEVRYCDEDVEFLRNAEEGFLSFSVKESELGPLRGKDGPCGLLK